MDNKPDWFDDTGYPGQQFFGVYATTPVKSVPGLSVDVYYLGLDRRAAVLDAGVANEERHSIGPRWFGKAGPIDFNFEGVYQFGRFGDRPISAFALFSDTGYTGSPQGLHAKPRIQARTGNIDYAAR